MMIRFKPSHVISVLMGASALLVGAAGYAAPQLRDRLYYQPQRDRAQSAALELAGKQTAFRRSKGNFIAFAAGNGAALKTLGMTNSGWPLDGYQFDARATAEKGLLVRALPRGEAVQALEVGAQMFVVELAPSGGVRRSGWYP
jgi:hypothetical protein